MYQPFARSRRTSLFLFILLAVVPISAQEFRQVHDGIEHAETVKEIAGKNVRINLLRLDLDKVRLDVVHAMDAAIGTEKTSSIAARHGALAAINAGFFRLDTSIFAGDSVGLLRIDGAILSESNGDRTALVLNERFDLNRTDALIDRIGMSRSLTIGGESFPDVGINRERKEDDIVIYTPEFHRTTLTGSDGIELLVKGNRISRVFDARGSSLIPEYSYVISASGKFRDRLKKAAVIGTRVTSGQKWKNLPPHLLRHQQWDAVAGVPQLVKNGKVSVTWQEEKSSKAFVETRHPRTAVALLKDGKFLMATLDGRSDTSAGIGLYDLADYLVSLGAMEAMNLDGGGSTTMFLNGKVINKPSDQNGERKVSDAVIVRHRTKRKLRQ